MRGSRGCRFNAAVWLRGLPRRSPIRSSRGWRRGLRSPGCCRTVSRRHGWPIRRHARMLAQRKRPMRRLLAIALMSWLGACVAQAGQAKYPQTYNDPLVFGMTREDVARLIDAPLVYLSGARGSERYLVERMST